MKVCALLAYLAVEADRPHRREQLVGLLWPECPDQIARHNLRQALFNLRLVTGDHTATPPFLLITRDTIQFNSASDYSLDLVQFNTYYYTCEEHLSRCKEDCSIRAARLEEMVKLYRGEFLKQLFLEDGAEFEEWTLAQRENLHQRVLEAHSYLANYYDLHRDFKAARRHAARQLELDPWREEAQRQMMRALALDGQRSAALAQYETCKRLLAEELDVEPSPETHELYEQIRLGTLQFKTDLLPAGSSTPVQTLPVQLTPFIGREVDLEQLGTLIADPESRCISLVGPGGTGKTRLAVQAAADALNAFTHGAAFVPLAPVGSIAGVIPAIANAINFAFYGPGDPKALLLNHLREKQMLLILDNVEHLLIEDGQQENFAQLLIEILQNAPALKLLVTSREALNLQGESLFEVRGLTFPGTEQTEGFDEFDAVALFVQRARRAFPKFRLGDENRSDVAHICRLVEGMPLAIELAATWMRVLTPAEIAVEIKDSVDFLSTSVRDLPERHRSMRVVFDHSWQMLSPDEQRVLSQLSVFRGGFQRKAAEQVAGASLSILSTLVNRTLLRRSADGRYDLHELVRQYGAAQLATDPDAKTAVQGRHYACYLALAEAAEQELKGRNQLEWLGRLEQDHDNLRVALEWALEQDGLRPGEEQLSLKLSAAMRWFWRMRGHFHEGCNWLTEALRLFPEKRSAARANALLGMSLLENALGDLGAARVPAEESGAIYRELGLQYGLAEAYVIEGLTLLWQGNADQGRARTRAALEIYRKLGDRWGEAHALYRLGSYLSDYNGEPAGRAMLKESATILEQLEEKYLYTSVLISLGIVDLSHGDYDAAKPSFERGLAATREIRHPWGIADALTNLGCLFRIRGDYAGAQLHFEKALQVYQEHGRNIWETDVYCALAENAIAQGDFSSARTHLQSASNLVESSENKWLQVLVRYFQGQLAFHAGDAGQAAGLLEETTRLARESQFKPDLARALLTLGRARLSQGELVLADELLREGLDLFQKIGHKLGIAITFEALASLSVSEGDPARAVSLFSTANGMRQALGAPLPPVDRLAYDAAVGKTRAQLGKAVFADLWEQAAAKTFEEVLADILKADQAN